MKRYLIFALFLFALIVTVQSAFALDNSNNLALTSAGNNYNSGFNITINVANTATNYFCIDNTTRPSGETAPYAYIIVYNSTFPMGRHVANATFGGSNVATFATCYNVTLGQKMGMIVGNMSEPFGNSPVKRYATFSAFPITGTNTTEINWTQSIVNTTGGYGIQATFAFGVQAIGIKNMSVNITGSTLTIQIQNVINGSVLSGFCINATGSNTTQNLCNSTGNAIIFNTTGTYNITAYGINNSYFNVTKQNHNFNSTSTVTLYTYQALLNVSAYRLFTNATISSFNITNNANFSYGPGLVPANNGSNNLKIEVLGNYSKNISCTATSLTTTGCNATGIYDAQFTIGAKANGVSINNFSVTHNSSIGGDNNSTTIGATVFNLLQGYYYTFNINATGYAFANATLQSNSSTNLYNFSLLTQNTFDLRFYNESTNTQLTNTTVYLSVISDVFSANYTTTNGTILIPLLTPSEYKLTYYYDSSVPRDYYVTLSPQSYQNLTLYTIDAGISNIYLPIIVDQSIKPVENATVSMLRYYVDCNCYKTVEMTKTDTNGQGVLRVVPNIIPYKLIISKDTYSFTTDPTKFTSSTNTYTLNLETNPLTSIQKIPSVSRSLSFNNATLTYTFTWADTQNLIIQGCLKVDKFHRGTYTLESNQCSSGSSGSIIYTLTDINETSYSAVGVLETNTQYGTYYEGPVDATFTSAFQFGIIGLFIGLIIMLAAIMLGNEMGTDMMVLLSVITLLGLAGFGIIIQSWTVTVPMLILGIVVIYKTRT